MQRLTEKDELGNWCLKGVRWEQLRVGQVLTKDVAEKVVSYTPGSGGKGTEDTKTRANEALRSIFGRE